jgi:hypothetical protein
VKHPLGTEAPPGYDPASYRFVILQRSVSHALKLTRERAPLTKQIWGWGVVASIFLAALACWGIVILAVTLLYHAL